MAADPLTLSLVAVIVTLVGSARTPVTTPVAETDATDRLLLVQVTGRSVSAFPAASFTVAANRTVLPTATVFTAGATVTAATCALTRMVAKPLAPSLVAVTPALPGPAPCTVPFGSTVATAAWSLAQVTGRPVSKAPFASRSRADSCSVPATNTVADSGVNVTNATGRAGAWASLAHPTSHPSAASIARMVRVGAGLILLWCSVVVMAYLRGATGKRCGVWRRTAGRVSRARA